jgi:hypothetical protein
LCHLGHLESLTLLEGTALGLEFRLGQESLEVAIGFLSRRWEHSESAERDNGASHEK